MKYRLTISYPQPDLEDNVADFDTLEEAEDAKEACQLVDRLIGARGWNPKYKIEEVEITYQA